MQITLGGQHISTRIEEVASDTRSRENTRTASASLGAHKAGGALRFSMLAKKSKQVKNRWNGSAGAKLHTGTVFQNIDLGRLHLIESGTCKLRYLCSRRGETVLLDKGWTWQHFPAFF